MSLLLNLGLNIIGDRGCRHISGGGWLRVKRVGMRKNQNISGDCSVREVGCRAMTNMAKQQGCLKWINCILAVTQVETTKSEWQAPAS